MTPAEALEKCRSLGAKIKNARDREGRPKRDAETGALLYDCWWREIQIAQEATMQAVTWEVAKRASREVEFGQANATQLSQRPFRITERGDIDPGTGNLKSVNHASQGVQFIGTIEQMVRDGILEAKHEDAADFFSGIWREVLGSPSSKTLFAKEIGGQSEGQNCTRYAQDTYAALRKLLSPMQRAELERTLWESDFGYSARPELLKAGLEVVSKYQLRKDRA